MSLRTDLAAALGLRNVREPAPLPLPPTKTRRKQEHRPDDLRQFVGQDEPRLMILSAIKGARARRKVPQHFLFSGPPGLGKTSLANLNSSETGGQLITVLGSQIANPAALVQLVARLSKKRVDTLFIDEVHGLKPAVMELLYLALEDLEFTVAQGRGDATSVETIEVPPFICVAATTLPGELTEPFRNRFKTHVDLEYYVEDDLATIIFDYISKDGGEIEPRAAEELASRSRGTPRIAQGLATASWDHAIVMRGDQELHITLNDVNEALSLKKIDQFGMGEKDRRVLRAHANRKGRPMGPKSAAQSTGLTTQEVESTIEPYLIHKGFIRLTERGRRITLLGFASLGLEPPTGFNDEAVMGEGWVDA